MIRDRRNKNEDYSKQLQMVVNFPKAIKLESLKCAPVLFLNKSDRSR